MGASLSKTTYNDKVQAELKAKFLVKIAPCIKKIVLNAGVGKSVSNKKYLETVIANMEAISNQKPVQTTVRQSEAGFGIRKGWPIGCKVTLRHNRMYEFLDRFLNIVIPRIPDFGGLNPKSFDGRGSYTMGLSDFAVFPECDIEQERLGLDITFVTSAKNNEEAYALLSMMGFPFKQTN